MRPGDVVAEYGDRRVVVDVVDSRGVAWGHIETPTRKYPLTTIDAILAKGPWRSPA